MLEGLQSILEKDIIVSTVNAANLLQDSQNVEAIYQHHVATFIPMGEMRELGDRLIRRIQSGKTSKGMLVAPYGYGKTSSLVFLWYACEEQNLIAVPPFYCASWLDILDATYGWVRFRLNMSQPSLADELDVIYEGYRATTLDDMAKKHANEHGIATNTALKILEGLLQQGNFTLELTPANLLLFLDEVTQLVQQADFNGLVILPDEFQQYISKKANLRDKIQQFREFVWGLDTRTAPLSVVFSLPTYAESVVQEQGKDILHRLKDDGLYYRLLDIYTSEFPSQLWDRYIETFELHQVANEIMESETLLSIGQIVEREDLGEGPRTVIECFKRAIECHETEGRAYTAVDLVDDFIETNIHFQAQANKLKSVTKQALTSSIVDTEAKEKAIKLLAAFPRGCSVDIQRRYDLYDAVNALSKQGHGDILTHLAEGYTLLGLQRGEAPVRTVDLVITEFWRNYNEDELHLEWARDAFADDLLGKLLQSRRGTASTGWGNLQFTTAPSGSYTTLVEGTYNTSYPRRRLRLQIAYAEEQISAFSTDADICFDFFLASGEYNEFGFIEQVEEQVVRFNLNVGRKFGPSMPDDIRKLQDFVNPEFVTPLLMLSLVSYFNRWEEMRETTIPESEKSEIDFFTDRLINHSIQLLFNEELANTYNPPLVRVGHRMIEELYNTLCERLFPDYHTLMTQMHWDNVLTDYTNAMRDMTLKERRGHTVVSGTKEALASRFGLGSVSTFETRAKSDYKHLLEIRTWKGRGDQGEAEITLELHPLETLILNMLDEGEIYYLDGDETFALPTKTIAASASQLGYRQAETLWALQLLIARRYIHIDQERKLVFLIQAGLDPAQVEAELKSLQASLESIPVGLLNDEEISELKNAVDKLGEIFASISFEQEEELDEISTQVSDLKQYLIEILSECREELRQGVSNLILEADRAIRSLKQADILDRQIQGQVAFVMHLNELRQMLSNDRKSLERDYQENKQELEQALNNGLADPVENARRLYEIQHNSNQRIQELKGTQEALDQRIQHLDQWETLLKEADQLFVALGPLPNLQEQLTRELVPEIESHFARRRDDKRDSLADWEPFREKLNVIEEELERQRRFGNQQFTEVKDGYESFLREADIGDWRLRSRYTYGEDDDSYRDLYMEILSKLKNRLGEVSKDLESAHTDWLKAHYIHTTSSSEEQTLDDTKEALDQAAEGLNELDQALSPNLIQQGGDELAWLVNQIKDLAENLQTVKRQLGPILFADHELNDEETQVLSTLEQRTDVDLTDLFVSLRYEGYDTELSTLLEIIEGLYRKNRLIVRIRRRG